MFQNTHSWLSPKLEVRPVGRTSGLGVFALRPLKKGELATVWSGRVIDFEELLSQPLEIRKHTVQVEEGLYLASLTADEPCDFINHSCDPNLGIEGQLSLRALRDIEPGEQVCFDYGTADGSVYDDFDCACGSAACRGRVSGEDWRRVELWDRYGSHFMPYLLRRIEELRRASEIPGAALG